VFGKLTFQSYLHVREAILDVLGTIMQCDVGSIAFFVISSICLVKYRYC
jgi:hypothetical protein